MHIFADQISKISLSNFNLRIELSQKTAEDQNKEVATLIIPVGQANNFVNGLANGLKQLDEKVKVMSSEKEKKNVQ